MILNKYKIYDKISEGNFGIVFKAENLRTKENVAIKIEFKSTSIKMLKNEAKIYQYLKNTDGFPQLKWFGSNNNINYLVFDLLGNSIKDIININKKFSLKSCLIIGIQMIKIIQTLHNKFLIHRDIKPENFLFGLGENTNKIYLIDFGLCKRYNYNGNHIDKHFIKNIIGSANFVSINIHNGIEPSRRDDLISCIYILIYMIYGNLPWFNKLDINNIFLLKRYT